MSRLHHRDLGVVGMMLLDDDSYAEVICDEIHASKLAVKLLYKNKTSRRLILVTDAMRAKLLGEGKYQLGGQDVYVNSDQARLVDGTLAGSVLRMIDGVKKMKAISNCSISELIQMASYNPAKLHKIDDRKGSIEIGKDADFLVVDQDLNIYETYCRGIKQ
jgi:N-acetylglucosamine-6-phosphate deacetylase